MGGSFNVGVGGVLGARLCIGRGFKVVGVVLVAVLVVVVVGL